MAETFALLIDPYLLHEQNKYEKFCTAFQKDGIDCFV